MTNIINFPRRHTCTTQQGRGVDIGDAIISSKFPGKRGFIEDVEVNDQGCATRFHVMIAGLRTTLRPGELSRAGAAA